MKTAGQAEASRRRINKAGESEMTPIRACVFTACLAAAGVAQAQNSPTASDDSLTWNGITLYGIVDIGLQYQTHGVPASDYFPGRHRIAHLRRTATARSRP